MKNKSIIIFVLLVITAISSLIILSSRKKYLLNQIPSPSDMVNIIPETKRKTQPFVLPILLYHYVEDIKDDKDYIRERLNTTPDKFISQINTLLVNGYQPILLTNLVGYFDQGTPLPQQPIIFTFDDGYRDFYTDVFPILQKYKVPAVLFVVSGFLDTTRNYLTSSQLQLLSRSNLIEIASHSVTHPDFSMIKHESAIEEISLSKTQIEKIIGRKIWHFAYPYGSFNQALIDEVQKAGFKTAVSSNRGNRQSYQNRYSLKRIKPGNFTNEAFLKLLL